MKSTLVGIVTILCLFSYSVKAEQKINVGLSQLNFLDEKRVSWDGAGPRPIVSHIFYPTFDSAIEPVVMGAPGQELFSAGEVVWNGAPIKKSKLPLIMLSHGTGGSALQMLWIAQKLVKNGYIVIGANHHGNTAFEQKKYPQGYVLWWERAQDLSAIRDALLSREEWQAIIDTEKNGVIGFSLGGHTALSMVGGRTDVSLFKQFCESDSKDATCDAQMEFPNIHEEFNKVRKSKIVASSLQRQSNSYKNDAIGAAFVIAPAVVQSLTDKSLREISVDTAVIIGSEDKVAPPSTNAKRISSLVSGASYIEVDKAGHYTFLSECTELGKKYLKSLCNDHESVSRNKVHDDVSAKAVDFFNRAFKYTNVLK